MNLPIGCVKDAKGSEATDATVIALLREMEVIIKDEDITVSHRLPRSGARFGSSGLSLH